MYLQHFLPSKISAELGVGLANFEVIDIDSDDGDDQCCGDYGYGGPGEKMMIVAMVMG